MYANIFIFVTTTSTTPWRRRVYRPLLDTFRLSIWRKRSKAMAASHTHSQKKKRKKRERIKRIEWERKRRGCWMPNKEGVWRKSIECPFLLLLLPTPPTPLKLDVFCCSTYYSQNIQIRRSLNIEFAWEFMRVLLYITEKKELKPHPFFPLSPTGARRQWTTSSCFFIILFIKR